MAGLPVYLPTVDRLSGAPRFQLRILALTQNAIMKPADRQSGAALHGLFSLVDGVSEEEFLIAFRAFYEHLKETGFVLRHRISRRQPLEGFGEALPDFDYHVEIEFLTLEQDRACYDYVKKNDEPIRSLHKAMNSKVKPRSAHFFLDAYI